ncbi:hypothetical protein KR093_011383 [Drosophila rubida]|uniref:Uncharacterized protein n=1 Tax=Drosophila rubida TaxID=30044 RepID=A0AAD4K2I6_9MUSC|nr:hypothetical protein KR093_011383 [Drosophila rubida]
MLTGFGQSGLFTIRKVSCKCYDPSFCEFKKCEMKVIRRGVIAFNSLCVNHQLPIDNLKLHLQLFKQSNGYQPFMINYTLDYCFYIRSPKSYPLFQAFHAAFMLATNFNHSCPINHDIVVDNLLYEDNRMLNSLPISRGEYLVVLKTLVSKLWRNEYKIYVSRND